MIQPILEWIMNFINDLVNQAQSYNVDPLTFIVIYFGTTPFLLIPLYYLGRIALKKTDKKYFFPLLTTLILAFLAPYMYVLLFGRGINIFIKIAIILFAFFALFRYLDKKLNIKIVALLRERINNFRKK